MLCLAQCSFCYVLWRCTKKGGVVGWDYFYFRVFIFAESVQLSYCTSMFCILHKTNKKTVKKDNKHPQNIHLHLNWAHTILP